MHTSLVRSARSEDGDEGGVEVIEARWQVYLLGAWVE
jgi:hypothetical protein